MYISIQLFCIIYTVCSFLFGKSNSRKGNLSVGLCGGLGTAAMMLSCPSWPADLRLFWALRWAAVSGGCCPPDTARLVGHRLQPLFRKCCLISNGCSIGKLLFSDVLNVCSEKHMSWHMEHNRSCWRPKWKLKLGVLSFSVFEVGPCRPDFPNQQS